MTFSEQLTRVASLLFVSPYDILLHGQNVMLPLVDNKRVLFGIALKLATVILKLHISGDITGICLPFVCCRQEILFFPQDVFQ